MFFARAGTVALALLAMLLLAAAATFGVSLSAVSLQPVTPSPAEVVASRFPSLETALPIQQATTFTTASVMPVERWETFDQGALSGIATAEPPWPTAAETATEVPAAIETTEPPIAEAKEEAAAVVETAKPTPPKMQDANAPARRVTSRSSNVLNDAQIASIKRRLNLTAEQERMWPPVEAALRKIVYTKSAMNPHTRGVQSSGSYIDPTSAEVRQLKAVALPLITRLNDEQKREVKMLAYVMGLEAVASQF